MNKNTLYITGTPIGNMKDITLRALEILTEVETIICEDTRRIRKILTRYDISTAQKRLVLYNDYNKKERVAAAVKTIQSSAGTALVSDAGMPLLSDPGYVLVNACLQHEINIEVIPGVSAVTTALANAALPAGSFVFLGFLPKSEQKKKAVLKQYADIDTTLIIFENGKRMRNTLTVINNVLGDTPVVICRELTKKFESIYRGTCTQLLSVFDEDSRITQGELTLCIRSAGHTNNSIDYTYINVYNELIKGPFVKNNIIKILCRNFNLSRNTFYKCVTDYGEKK